MSVIDLDTPPSAESMRQKTASFRIGLEVYSSRLAVITHTSLKVSRHNKCVAHVVRKRTKCILFAHVHALLRRPRMFSCASEYEARINRSALRPFTTAHVWAGAELLGACSGHLKSREVRALFQGIALRPAEPSRALEIQKVGGFFVVALLPS